MVFLKSIKCILSKFVNDICNNIYRSFLRIIGYIVVIFVIGLAASRCAKAMTINDNLRTINDTQIKMFENIYKRSNYDNYILSSSYNSSSYNNYIDYYLCLTNDKLDTSNVKKITSNCDELYKYNTFSNNYTFEKLNDNKLIVTNSIYYTSSIVDKNAIYNQTILLISICLFVIAIFISIILFKVFRL